MNQVSALELVSSVCGVIDLTSNAIHDHHNMVACGAYRLTEAMGISGSRQRDVVVAAAMHDVGGLSLKDRLDAVSDDFEDSNDHAEKGYRLLADSEPFSDIADFVRFHHTPWNYGDAEGPIGKPPPLESQILFLADRVSAMLSPGVDILNQAEDVIGAITANENAVYCKEVVEAFRETAEKPSFWLDMMLGGFDGFLKAKLEGQDVVLSGADMYSALNLLSDIIDYRSAFTATHSKLVSAVARELARLMGFSEDECDLMRAAGLLHDIGKLVVPAEILEKPGALDAYERNVIRTHTYYTDRALSGMKDFDTARKWASLHHENMDGSGYPFGLTGQNLSLGSRIMKVADVFAALMEDRPYRKSIGITKTLRILEDMAQKLELDRDVVAVLADNVQDVHHLQSETGLKASEHYRRFKEGLPR